MNLEDELQIPTTANMPASSGYSIKTLNGSSIDLSRTTSLRKASSPRCFDRLVGKPQRQIFAFNMVALVANMLHFISSTIMS
jgi:hypothetical protein